MATSWRSWLSAASFRALIGRGDSYRSDWLLIDADDYPASVFIDYDGELNLFTDFQGFRWG